MVEQCYELFREELFRYALGLCREAAEAEDLVQEAFVRALEQEARNSMELFQWKSWLYKTIRNLWIDRVRRIQNAPTYEGEVVSVDDLSGVFVAQLCEVLEPEEYTLFYLRYFEGYNAAELGDWFGQPSSTIRGKLLAARNKLKKYYPELKKQRKGDADE